jgi:carbon starvation protein
MNHAMPVMIAVLCLMAIAYRYYSAFLAAKVAALDETRQTPAEKFNDGQNFHPTNKWVLFGHHFAAISGAGPLIGPVLAAQFGYLPGLLWIVIGVCLGGAVQDFLVLAASMRRGGRSLAQIAFHDIGRVAGTAATAAILFIIVVALAGLGKVVVKALGGEEVKYPPGSSLVMPARPGWTSSDYSLQTSAFWHVPPGSKLIWNGGGSSMTINEAFNVRIAPADTFGDAWKTNPDGSVTATLPPSAVRVVPGSSWGTFTIACTIPIALFVGLYMYKIRPGRVVEASIIGAALTLVATFAGGWVANHQVGHWFNLSAWQVVIAMGFYGFVASVLPVWVLLCPRDYLSSFLKIGTIALLVIGTLVANPRLEAPAINHAFLSGGPVVPGKIFPFLFITIMCGAISGFHALVSSGTTPKMIKRETDARTIGYGSMLIEGLVGVVAMIAASTLPTGDYFAMNTDLAKVPQFHDKFVDIGADVDHLNVYEGRTQEALRGRTGGAVTLAVGMAHIFDGATARVWGASEATLKTLWKYWYHFAIMFEALFILTTIDTGTRIGRFLLQEVAGKIHPDLGRTAWWPGAIVSTALVVVGWSTFMMSDSFATIWSLFGIANQVLAVIALAVVSTWLANEGRARYLWVTVCPMLFVMVTTGTAAAQMLGIQINALVSGLNNGSWRFVHVLQPSLILAMLVCTAIVVFGAAIRIWTVTGGGEAAPRSGFEPAVMSR